MPTGRAVVESVAMPDERVAVPRLVAPFQNFTVPVGVPVRVAATVAFMVTDWPVADGLGDAVSAVVVGEEMAKVIDFAI